MIINVKSNDIKGWVDFTVFPGKKLDHVGIKMELVGQIGKSAIISQPKKKKEET